MIKEVEPQWKIPLTRKQVSIILKQILIFLKKTDPKAWVSSLPILSSIRKIDGFYRFNHFNRRNNHQNGRSSCIWVESQRQPREIDTIKVQENIKLFLLSFLMVHEHWKYQTLTLTVINLWSLWMIYKSIY